MSALVSRRLGIAAIRHACWLIPCLAYCWAAGPAPRADGRDLHPLPDALEYSLIAGQLARGEPPLLHVGLQQYPSRYSMAYPLLLVPFAWIFRFDLTQLHWASFFFGLTATFLIAIAGRRILRSAVAGSLAALFWALHPETTQAASANMSETAITAAFFLALHLALTLFGRNRRLYRTPAILLGLTLGWLAIAKTPFAYWAAAIAGLAFYRAAQARPIRLGPPILLCSTGLACLILELGYRRWAFGDFAMNGYRYWQPATYGDFSRVFNSRYLSEPALAMWPDGNLPYYGRMLLGLNKGDLFYSRYMFPAAIVSGAFILFSRRGAPSRPLAFMMLGWTAIQFAFCLLYFYQSPRFFQLWVPVADLAVAWGIVFVPRKLGRFAFAARLASIFALAILLRGEILRTHGRYHHPDDPRRRADFASQIESLIPIVPDHAWLLTNYQLPLVQAFANGRILTGALNAWLEDSFLMNGHVYDARRFSLPSHIAIGASASPAWQRGPTLAIDGNDRWFLTPAELRELGPMIYILVIDPKFFPSTGRHFSERIRPMLEAQGRLEAIGSTADVVLYRLRFGAPPPDSAPGN